MWQSDADDERLIGEIGAALSDVDEVPPGARELAQAVFELGGLDRELELLTLLYDSSREPVELSRSVGSYVAARYLTFQHEMVTLEVEIGPTAIIGQVVPVQPATLSLVSQSGAVEQIDTDELGGFAFDLPTDQVIRLTCVTGTSQLRTTWISLRTNEP